MKLLKIIIMVPSQTQIQTDKQQMLEVNLRISKEIDTVFSFILFFTFKKPFKIDLPFT